MDIQMNTNTPWTAQRITGEDLYNTYYRDPFSSTGEEPDMFDRLRYLDVNEMMKEEHIIITQDGKVIGNIALQENPYNNTQWWIKHITVDPAFQNQKVATTLIHDLFKFARERRMSLKRSTPSREGQRHLTIPFLRIKANNPDVDVIAHDR